MDHTPHDVAPTSGWNVRTLLRIIHSQSQRGGLWRHHDFMQLWIGQTISQFGSTVTREGLPYMAILMLGATPVQMGLLGAAGSAPLLLLGLFAGVWVDRLRRRPLMIAADIGRAMLLLSIPLAFLFGLLRMEQLYVVAALMGVMSIFFDVSYQSFLPSLVQREQLVEGNSKLGISASLAEIGGPPLGGALVQLVGGPLIMLLDAFSFICSAFLLRRIRASEPAPIAAVTKQHIWRDIVTGLRVIVDDPMLRPLAIAGLFRSFFGWFFGAIYGLYALRTLGLSPALVGITVAAGGVGALVGALLVAPITRRFGVGPTIVGSTLIGGMTSMLIWLAGGMPAAALVLMITSQLVGDAMRAIGEINQLSLRQMITPAHVLGRVQASMHVVDHGIGTLGLLVSGVLAETIGLRSTVAVALIGGLIGGLWLWFSPVRHVRAIPEQDEQE